MSNIADEGQPPQWVSLSPICPACAMRIRREMNTQRREAAKDARQQALADAWAKFGPDGEDNTDNIYREVDVALLPLRAVAQTVLSWNPNQKKGLLIFGDTGQGKTFMLYALARRCLLEFGVEPLLFSGVSFRLQISEAARHAETTKRRALVARMINAPVLMIDDLGQAAKSDSAEEALWEVTEGRTSRGRPMIVTTQFIGECFSQRFLKPETGAAVIRRLSQYCQNIRAATI